MLARLFAYVQLVLPKFWLTAVVYRMARIRHVAIKNFLITRFVRLFDIDTGDIKLVLPNDFATFNDFFIRELREGARPVDASSAAIVSPADGTISQAGHLRGGALLQAKGIEYSLDDLFASNIDDARVFDNGCFATIYLAPYNYHRVHAPLAAELVSASYVPGELFSVNVATAANIRGLFRRNERLILNFLTQHGPAALIFVGALNVGSISTPWTGELRPRHAGGIETIDLGSEKILVHKGDLLGWFNMGSTVILLLPGELCEWRAGLCAGATVRMGEAIGTLRRLATEA
ncbi:MAG: archaetidylserine decarboxylase [Gammaproteobacteria bacterium]|nr:archaetidylserine decarboxylase [Gammaproteobacteria bacterium]MDH5304168.1 archaetidylserine decarboxylase [Gammaproteobacteria bacterium]MDH5321565.1 archaetidylserine decarboxylase [Gammaproteobacteria bacterium]